jgi:hypothetical protein
VYVAVPGRGRGWDGEMGTLVLCEKVLRETPPSPLSVTGESQLHPSSVRQ